MQKPRVYTAIGLMSGTSLDGIDAALIRTDGDQFVERLAFLTIPYDMAVRDSLRGCLGLESDADGRVRKAENDMTLAHAGVVKNLLALAHIPPSQIDMIGFHGQTVFHDPANGFTWQIGDGALLARETGIRVINDFRTNDVKAGGQGAPLIPVYHAALASAIDKPVAILNIGGVSNVTWIGGDGSVLAFDTGPGNALINDWVHEHTGADLDLDGQYAAKGFINHAILSRLMQNPFFTKRPPKSLDRDAWDVSFLKDLPLEDGAATLSAFTVRAVEQAVSYMPEKPVVWYVTGGGRHNPVLMGGLSQVLKTPVYSVNDLGWDGDALEAEGFAYLAVRSHLGMPLSFPTTTGVAQPVTGGQSWLP